MEESGPFGGGGVRRASANVDLPMWWSQFESRPCFESVWGFLSSWRRTVLIICMHVHQLNSVSKISFCGVLTCYPAHVKFANQLPQCLSNHQAARQRDIDIERSDSSLIHHQQVRLRIQINRLSEPTLPSNECPNIWLSKGVFTPSERERESDVLNTLVLLLFIQLFTPSNIKDKEKITLVFVFAWCKWTITVHCHWAKVQVNTKATTIFFILM